MRRSFHVAALILGLVACDSGATPETSFDFGGGKLDDASDRNDVMAASIEYFEDTIDLLQDMHAHLVDEGPTYHGAWEQTAWGAMLEVQALFADDADMLRTQHIRV